MTHASVPTEAAPTRDRLRIDFLFLDLTSCSRCRGTDASLESALAAVRDTLESSGTEVELTKTHVASAEQARELRFVSSPTIRVNGRDVALELRESSCGSEACTDGCGEHVDCRVWVHEGREHTVPPVAMLVAAIERALSHPVVDEGVGEAEPYVLPANLERFFAGAASATTEALLETSCCSPPERLSCCEPEDKGACCGASTETGCGCR